MFRFIKYHLDISIKINKISHNIGKTKKKSKELDITAVSFFRTRNVDRRILVNLVQGGIALQGNKSHKLILTAGIRRVLVRVSFFNSPKKSQLCVRGGRGGMCQLCVHAMETAVDNNMQVHISAPLNRLKKLLFKRRNLFSMPGGWNFRLSYAF